MLVNTPKSEKNTGHIETGAEKEGDLPTLLVFQIDASVSGKLQLPTLPPFCHLPKRGLDGSGQRVKASCPAIAQELFSQS